MAKNKKFINLLYYGDFDSNTGFGMVSKNLIDNWSKKLGDNGLISVFATKKNVYVIPAIRTRSEKDNDIFCRNSFLKLLYNGNYTHLFCLSDIEVQNQMAEYLHKVKADKRKENKPSFKSVFYFPIDSPIRKSDLEVLKFFDKNVTYTEYGKSIIKELVYPNVLKKVSIIPHGTNTKDFYPIEDTSSLREKHFGLNKDKFVFGTINRNSARKDIGTLMIAFKQFVSKHPDSFLYIHSNPNDKYGINLFRFAERLELEIGKHLQISNTSKNNIGTNDDPIETLNELYNSFDCFVTSTTAEGWGLTVTEAMATKTKVICPIHTSLKEITNDGELVIPLRRFHKSVFVNDYDKIRYKCDIGELENAMTVALEKDKKNLATLSYEKVVKLNWTKISNTFLTLIKGL